MEGQADPDFVVAPDERLDWGRTVGIGAQHAPPDCGGLYAAKCPPMPEAHRGKQRSGYAGERVRM